MSILNVFTRITSFWHFDEFLSISELSSSTKGAYIKYVGGGGEAGGGGGVRGFYKFFKKKKNRSPGHRRPKSFIAQ